jgi:hypothetical protein
MLQEKKILILLQPTPNNMETKIYVAFYLVTEDGDQNEKRGVHAILSFFLSVLEWRYMGRLCCDCQGYLYWGKSFNICVL